MAFSRPQLVLAHAKDRARPALAQHLEAGPGIKARCPDPGETIEV